MYAGGPGAPLPAVGAAPAAAPPQQQQQQQVSSAAAPLPPLPPQPPAPSWQVSATADPAAAAPPPPAAVGPLQQSAPRQRRRCAEVCNDLLVAEAASLFTQRQYGPAAPAALEAVGFRVGRQLAERYSRDKARLGDTLEVIKFVCKDFWQAVFRKQVDNLKTNHRGIFVLQDHSFRWLLRLAPTAPLADGARAEAQARAAQPYLHLPCGIIRGALTHLGVNCTVEADARALPSCSFTIKITA
ncbi:trafficking particle complex subunit 6B [Raphidocelis subcapitata]|uniref:Trafficking particle complex subunit 6B n=1 Tax=Raphidocelis subcapitata TaxID=307507 RepID=A0A2V0NSF8_9CHLO|nr:trafficking particle complex subunit 6B [Raphidocelis subcapitata]|eukprot:GBF87775.1 trafficking particle complex subunit 6B [Raphidocelis subcapitata]